MTPPPEGTKGSSELSIACKRTIGGQECPPFFTSSSRDVPIVKRPRLTHPTTPGLSPLAVEHPLPFSSILVDLITGLPDSHGYDSVMVMVDHGFTKGVIYCPCTKNIDSEGVAQLFFTYVFPQFGLHSKIISDRGPQFASAFA